MPSGSTRTLTGLCGGGVAIVSLALAFSGTFSGVADAAPAPADPAGRSSAHTVSPAKASKYWTKKRMRQAKPVRRKASIPSESRRDANPQAEVKEVAPLDKGNKDQVVGKVFFSMGGSDYVCSGSVVNSEGAKNLVSTAGHCTYDTEGGEWATNWIFVPGYDNGDAPHGKWSAEELNTLPEYQAGDHDFDFSFVELADLDGKRIEDEVGAAGFSVNEEIGTDHVSLGYPAAPPFDGETLETCQDSTIEAPDVPEFEVEDDVQITCNLTGGSSGGPWQIRYDQETGSGYVNGVNSLGNNQVMLSPYFNDTTWNLYQTAITE